MKKRILIPLICVIACMVVLFTYLMVATNYKKVYTFDNAMCTAKVSINPKAKENEKEYKKVLDKVYDKITKFLTEDKKNVTFSNKECYIEIVAYDKNYTIGTVILESKNCNTLTINKVNKEIDNNLIGINGLQSYAYLASIYSKCSVKYIEYPLMKSMNKVIMYYYDGE